MNQTKNYYEDIMKGFQGLDYTGWYVRAANALFVSCQQYYWNYGVREKMKEKDVERVLREYYKRKISRRLRNSTNDIDIKDRLYAKLYLEFLGEIQSMYYANKIGFEKFLDSITFNKDIINRCFKTSQEELLETFRYIKKRAEDSAENNCFTMDYYRRYNLKNVKNIMEDVRNALKTEKPPIDVSVEAVIAEEWLEKILDYLKAGCLPGAAFTVMPIKKALTGGAYHKYIKGNGNVFFNLKSDYNLSKLKDRVDATRGLLEDYDCAIEEIEDYRRQLKSKEEFKMD